MVKKKFGGEKVDVKAVLAEPKPKAAPAVAWSKGGNPASLTAPPPSQGRTAAPLKSVPATASATGAWARGGPQGLAATSTSLQAAAKNPGFAPSARPAAGFAVGPKHALDPKGKGRGLLPSFDSEAFPEAVKPPTADQLDDVARVAMTVSAFPETFSGDEAFAALCKVASLPVADRSSLEKVFEWLLKVGVPDAADETRIKLFSVGKQAISGEASRAPRVLVVLESYFAEQQKSGKTSAKVLEVNGLTDAYLFGTVAFQLEDNTKSASIRERLVRRLLKPTTTLPVQTALADALLEIFTQDAGSETPAAETSSKRFLEELGSLQEGVRRGAALGLAAVSRSAGAALRKSIIDALKENLRSDDKRLAGKREGSLIVIGEFADHLGRAFEPYAAAILPLILKCCGEDKKEAYTAGQKAGHKVVSNASTTCMKLMVKPLLESAKAKQWRTQLAAVNFLGCIVSEFVTNAARRLALILPDTMPVLCLCASSPRSEIRDAARAVFDRIASNVQHRDIAALAPQIVAALSDPAEGPVDKAIDALLSAVYTTAIDAAAFALVCPVVERALSRGDAGAQQKGANFTRGLVLHAGAADGDDLTPFFKLLQSPLQALLSSPNPAVREAAAQAIGAFGGDDAPDMSTTGRLLERLDAQQDGAEREGTAQGIAAVMDSSSEDVQNEILAELVRRDVPVSGRLSRLCALAHLPKAMKAASAGRANVLLKSFTVLVDALSDVEESIREFGRRGLSASVEEIEDSEVLAGLAEILSAALQASDSHCRRLAAEITFPLVSKRALTSNVPVRASLVTAILIAQADQDSQVRRVADRVWRAAADGNGTTGKQLRDLKPAIIARITEDCESGTEKRGRSAGRAAVKLHERLETQGGLIQDLAPFMSDALYSDDEAVQTATCAALCEIFGAPSCLKHATEFGPLIVSLRSALLSSSPSVRAAAAICACSATPDFVVNHFASKFISSTKDLPAEDVTALEELLRADMNGVTLKLALAAIAQTGQRAQVAIIVACAAAPRTVVAQQIPAVIKSCVDICSVDLDLTSGIAAAWANGLSSENAQLFLEELCDKIQRFQTDRVSETAVLLVGEVVAAMPSPPLIPNEILDSVLFGSLLAAENPCAASFARSLKAFVTVCGDWAMEEIPNRCDELVSKAPADAQLLDMSFEVLSPVLQKGLVAGPMTQRISVVKALTHVARRVAETTLQGQSLKCAGSLVRALADKTADEEFLEEVLNALAVLLERSGSVLRALKAPLATALVKALDNSGEKVQSAAVRGCTALAAKEPKIMVKSLGKAPPKKNNFEALSRVVLALKESDSTLLIDIRDDVVAAAQLAMGSPDQVLHNLGDGLMAVAKNL